MANIAIELVGWEKVVQKYGKAAAHKAVKDALTVTTSYTADLVKQKIAGKHHVTGFLLSSIVGEVKTDDQGKTFARPGGAVYYARFVERGTGIHGPFHMPIRPTRAKVLSWHPRSATGATRRKDPRTARRSVKGQPPVQMFHKTFIQDKHLIQTKFKTAFRRSFGA